MPALRFSMYCGADIFHAQVRLIPSERTQRQIDRLLDEAEQAMAQRAWGLVRQHVQDVLDLDPDNADAREFLAAMERKREAMGNRQSAVDPPAATTAESSASNASGLPTAFDNGRYTVKKFLDEGGKKKVYLAHDKMLDRDVAFALIKTEGLDDVGRERVSREAQAMGRLGSHPHIVTVYDLGDEPPLPLGSSLYTSRCCVWSAGRFPSYPGPFSLRGGKGDAADGGGRAFPLPLWERVG